MRTIYLYGELSDLFIDKIELEVKSIHEAIKALSANFPNFANYILKYKPGFHVKVGDILREEVTIKEPIGNKDIHLIPVVAGSGKIGMIVAGAFLIFMTAGAAAAAALPAGTTAAAGSAAAVWTGSTLGGAISASMGAALGQIGVGLVMSGISAILFAPPKPTALAPSENTPNTYFNGSVNTVAQGLPVPIGYGELIIGSAIISAAVSIDSTTGIKTYDWQFPEVDNVGWTLISGTLYQSNTLNIKYDKALGQYSWVTGIILPSYYDVDEQGNFVEFPSISISRTFKYNEYTSRFNTDPLPITKSTLFASTFNDKYGSVIGSSEIPEGWGT